MKLEEYNRESWDRLVARKDPWTLPVDATAISLARKGELAIVLTPNKYVPHGWFPEHIAGKSVLCLASGGGQQGPLLAAAGAHVTVLDNSPKQLEQDEFVARREGLSISLELGDMRDISRFPDGYFDLIVNPVSNCFIDSVLPVWGESYRVLKQGGSLLAGFANPIMYIFDLKSWEGGSLKVRHKIPYSDQSSLSEEELGELVLSKGEPMCFGHTLEDQIQGQIEAGFLIAGMYEDGAKDGPLNQYIDSFVATRAIKASVRSA